MSTTTTTRIDYTAGLRALADLLDAHPEIRLPFEGTEMPISWGVHGTYVPEGKDVPEEVADLARLLVPGTRTKDVDDSYYRLRGNLHGLRTEVWALRDSVCERVVTGTREVTTEVPDPDALAAVPTVTVTETVETVEWVCAPLLAPVSA